MSVKNELHSPAMEKALVACGLVDGGVYDLAGVLPEHFHNRTLATIWRVLGSLRHSGEDVDNLTVMHQLDARGSGVTLSELSAILATDANVAHWETYARVVLEQAHRREVAGILSQAARVVHGSGGSYADDLAAVRDRLSAAVGQLRDMDRAGCTPPKTAWTVAELLSTDFPEPRWAVPGLVPVGLTLLAGRPKVGKSWLALQIAQAVGAGGMVLGQRVEAGSVLYLALEDSPRRLKGRLLKQGAASHANILFRTEWRRFTDGGLADLEAALAQGSYRLVIIDTFTRALGRVDQDDQADMGHFMELLQRMALDRDGAIVVIDHHRKPKGFVENPIDDILGATAKSSNADSALGLFKEQGKAGAVLKVIGRDLEWRELALSWDAVTCCWQLEGTVEEVSLRGCKARVLDALRNADDAMTLTEIAGITGLDKGNLLHVLNELVDGGQVVRGAKQGREVPYRLGAGAQKSGTTITNITTIGEP